MSTNDNASKFTISGMYDINGQKHFVSLDVTREFFTEAHMPGEFLAAQLDGKAEGLRSMTQAELRELRGLRSDIGLTTARPPKPVGYSTVARMEGKTALDDLTAVCAEHGLGQAWGFTAEEVAAYLNASIHALCALRRVFVVVTNPSAPKMTGE